MGLVGEVFRPSVLKQLNGNIGIGHVRYSTTGASTAENAQPLVLKYLKGTLALAHNGNLTNVAELRQELQESGAIFHTTTDSEVIACCIARERTRTACVEDAILQTARRLKGGYALVIMSPRKLVGVRDPLGLKPLCLGKRGSSYILASESCALAAVGASFIRDIAPGEIITVTRDQVQSDRRLVQDKHAHCIFEYIYFARLDSTLDSVNVYDARIRAGRALAASCPANADLVHRGSRLRPHRCDGICTGFKPAIRPRISQKQLCGQNFHQTHAGGTGVGRPSEARRTKECGQG